MSTKLLEKNASGKSLGLNMRGLALAASFAAFACLPLQAVTTTQTYNLGTSPAGTTINGAGASTLFVWVGKGSLPAGSILRSVTATAVKLEDNPSGSWASDIAVFFDSTPDTPGGPDGLLCIADDSSFGGAAAAMNWNGQGQNDGPMTTTLTAGVNFPDTIDLSTAAVMIGSAWGTATWSGTITIEYDVSALGVTLTSPAATQGYPTGTSITATAVVVEPGAFTDTVTFHTTPIAPAGPTVDTVSSDSSSPFSAVLGVLPEGTYEIYATVTNNDSPSGTATSATNTFTVAAAIPTTTALASSTNSTSYGQS